MIKNIILKPEGEGSMIFLVVGLGSMGKRRVRLLKEYINNAGNSNKNDVIIGADSSDERRREAEMLFGIETYSGLEDAIRERNIDCAIISSPPLSHAVIIEMCLRQNIHVFTELNLTDDGYDANMALAKERGRILFLSSTFMYRKEIQYIKENIKDKKIGLSYRYHTGQYLPDWHPWESYHDFFVGEKKTNGCREIFAIELPWLIDVFGDVSSMQIIHRKISRLNIDYDDVYHVLIEHKSGIIGNMTVDVASPKAGREFEVWGEKFYLAWGGTPDSLKMYSADSGMFNKIQIYDHVEYMEGYHKFIVENAYYEELINFIAVIKGQQKPRHTFEKDREILRLINQIEE